MTARSITIYSGVEVRIGDVYEPQAKQGARYTVTGFSPDGEYAHVTRTSSHRTQSILVRRLGHGAAYTRVSQGPR